MGGTEAPSVSLGRNDVLIMAVSVQFVRTGSERSTSMERSFAVKGNGKH